MSEGFSITLKWPCVALLGNKLLLNSAGTMDDDKADGWMVQRGTRIILKNQFFHFF